MDVVRKGLRLRLRYRSDRGRGIKLSIKCFAKQIGERLPDGIRELR